MAYTPARKEMKDGEHLLRAENKERATRNIACHVQGSRREGENPKTPTRERREGENPKTPIIGCAISHVSIFTQIKSGNP